LNNTDYWEVTQCHAPHVIIYMSKGGKFHGDVGPPMDSTVPLNNFMVPPPDPDQFYGAPVMSTPMLPTPAYSVTFPSEALLPIESKFLTAPHMSSMDFDFQAAEVSSMEDPHVHVVGTGGNAEDNEGDDAIPSIVELYGPGRLLILSACGA
jgi:hypothetical protein